MQPHHTLEVDPACGLDAAEAAARLACHGPNQPRQAPGRSALARLATQFTAPLVLVLIVAGSITAALGEYVDSTVIFGVVVINALVGYIQEGKAEAALAALARAIATHAIVVRNSARQRLDAVHLVPGDIVWLAAGDRVPADLRLLTGHQLRSVEAHSPENPRPSTSTPTHYRWRRFWPTGATCFTPAPMLSAARGWGWSWLPAKPRRPAASPA
jgi:magnesium-transporting ATPase (P-type)